MRRSNGQISTEESEIIRVEMCLRRLSVAQIARELGVTRGAVMNVRDGRRKSQRIKDHLFLRLGLANKV